MDKPISEFRKVKKGDSRGLYCHCKDCEKAAFKNRSADIRQRKRQRDRNRKNRNHYAESFKKWNESQKNKLTDYYIVKLLTDSTGIPSKIFRENPILIKIKREAILLMNTIPDSQLKTSPEQRRLQLRRADQKYKLSKKIMLNPTHANVSQWVNKLETLISGDRHP